MVILAVDYGDTRTGIAVCDKNEILASPVCTLKEKDRQALANKIVEVYNEKKAQMIVVGLPRNMDGTYGYRCDECKALADEIKSIQNIDIQFEDERLTTVMAHNFLNTTDTRGKKRKAVVDAVSAVLILESYINKRNNSR